MKYIIFTIALFFTFPVYADETAIADMPTAEVSCDDELILQEDGETIWNKTTICDILSSPFNEKTSNYTLTSSDIKGTIYYNSTGNGTLTIPSGLTIDNGDFIGFVQGGSGTLSLSSSGTMTLNTFTGFTTKGQYARGTVHFRSSTEGIVSGELE